MALTGSSEPFKAPATAVVANVLWFLSLVVALICALLATLVQQWTRNYKRNIKQRNTIGDRAEIRALNHVYIRMGIDRYKMDVAVSVIVMLVHIAVILFTAGLVAFLFPINDTVA